ncbi:MAG TPA: ABC transporter permease [Candidatus Dormibacteraeota bacterium]|nr:ABC transporter permease [Candidatus Dormibacteraeota bacterium]
MIAADPLAAVSAGRPAAADRPWRHVNLVLGLSITIAVLLAAILAGTLAPHPPLLIDVSSQLQGPSSAHLLGTDQLGRDTLSRAIYASRVSIEVALISVGIGAFFGVAIGSVSAWYGGALDMALMRCMDILYSFPAILLAIAIMGGLGTSVVNAMIAIGIIFIPGFARLSRAASLVVLKGQFVDAARAVGMSTHRILIGEVLPNILPVLLVQVTSALAGAIIVESSLSFIGLGTQPPDPSWGNMLQQGRSFIQQDAWMALTPGVAIFVAVLGLNLLGDGLRDHLDPRLRGWS